MRTILVCGGRTYRDRDRVFGVLDWMHKDSNGPITCILDGGATGADAAAGEWARANRVEHKRVFADWGLGRRAGPLRNRQMLDMRPDGLVAFPGGRGTLDITTEAYRRHIPVYPIDWALAFDR